MSDLYFIKIATNGQPYISLDETELYRVAMAHCTITSHESFGRTCYTGKPYIHLDNGGVRRVSGALNAATFTKVVRAMGAGTRKLKSGVKVSPPATMVKECARLEALWQEMAAAGRTDFGRMRCVILDAMTA